MHSGIQVVRKFTEKKDLDERGWTLRHAAFDVVQRMNAVCHMSGVKQQGTNWELQDIDNE